MWMCHRTSLMRSQHWIRRWLSAINQATRHYTQTPPPPISPRAMSPYDITGSQWVKVIASMCSQDKVGNLSHFAKKNCAKITKIDRACQQPNLFSQWSKRSSRQNCGHSFHTWYILNIMVRKPKIHKMIKFHHVETRQIWGIWKLRPAYSPEMPNLGQNRWCFVPFDLEIWWMTLENYRASLLCCFKLCATLHSHRCIQTGVTVRKRPIFWVKFDDF